MIEAARLWLSYQRFALAWAAAALALPVTLALLGAPWWGWAAPLPLSAWGLARARSVARQWGVKRGETRRADRRIASGEFHADQVARWCVDPCWRVVAREVLRRSGMSAAEVRETVRRFSAA